MDPVAPKMTIFLLLLLLLYVLWFEVSVHARFSPVGEYAK